jgi:hypothetical protein
MLPAIADVAEQKRLNDAMVGRPSSRTIRIGFHGDNGVGLGASHQTGWTGLIDPLLDLVARVDAKSV